MPERLRQAPPKQPVTFSYDDEDVVAAAGETVAMALHGAGYLALSRSPKFHRPRGASCHRGGCEGCLVRIDGAPNQMACLVTLRPGMRVQTQNTFGTRELDLLRVTDWVFPHGINHHEFMAGVPGVQDAMQAIARRITGLGHLPDAVQAPRPARERDADVLILGSGPSAQALAAKLAAVGRAVELVDDGPKAGGSLRFMMPTQRSTFAAIEAAFAHAGCAVRSHMTAGAVFDGRILLLGPDGAELVRAKTLVLATGAHDTMPPFSGNDIPGVMSARAASLLASNGIRPGKRALIVAYPESGPFGRTLAAEADITMVQGTVVSVSGVSHVTSAVVHDGRQAHTHVLDALIVDAPAAPSYELAVHVGAQVEHAARGFVVKTHNGKIAEGVYAVGEMVGTPLEAAAIEAEAMCVAECINLP